MTCRDETYTREVEVSSLKLNRSIGSIGHITSYQIIIIIFFTQRETGCRRRTRVNFVKCRNSTSSLNKVTVVPPSSHYSTIIITCVDDEGSTPSHITTEVSIKEDMTSVNSSSGQ